MKYASLRQGLVGAWCPSLGPSGNTLIDRSGYGNHGTLTNMDAGTDWVASQYGWALDFDGTNDGINIGGIGVLPTDRSVSIWVYQRTFNPSVASRWFTLASEAFVIRESSGSIDRYFFDTSNTLRRATSVAVNFNQWQHYVLTFNGSSLSVYRNGIALVSDTFAFTPRTNNGGAAISSVSEPLNGQIDDVRLYSRVVTPQEIRLLASEPGIGLKPERTSVFFGAQLFNAAWAKNSNQLISAGVI